MSVSKRPGSRRGRDRWLDFKRFIGFHQPRNGGSAVESADKIEGQSAGMGVPRTGSSSNGISAEIEREVIALFVRVADLLGLPRSVGELYGALYISPRPLHMDALRTKLNLSKGATSQGLRLLRRFGAVRSMYMAGDRRDYYVAETTLRPLLGGFLREQVQPHLKSGKERLEALEVLLSKAPAADRAFLEERVGRLANWRRRSERLLPVIMKLIRV